MGAVVCADPISTAGGPSLYAFTGGRPLHNRDPLGLLPVTVFVDSGSCMQGFGGQTVQLGDTFAGNIGKNISVGD